MGTGSVGGLQALARLALELLQRFWHLVGRATSITLDTAGETGSVTLDVRVPMDAEGTALIKEITLVSMVRGVRGLAPGAEEALEVWFDFPEPPQGAWVRERLGRVRCQLLAPRLVAARRRRDADVVHAHGDLVDGQDLVIRWPGACVEINQ